MVTYRGVDGSLVDCWSRARWRGNEELSAELLDRANRQDGGEMDERSTYLKVWVCSVILEEYCGSVVVL